MFKTKFPPFIMRVGEEFEPGGGDSVSEVVEGLNAADDVANNPQPDDAGESEPNMFAQQDEPAGINPAWNPVLNEIPEEFRSKVTPYLSEWDKNYHSGLEKARNEVQSQYADFQPFIDNEVSPETLAQSYQLYQALENNPQSVMEALQQAIGETYGEDDDQGDDEHYDPNDIANDPRYQRLEQQVQQMMEGIQSKEEQEQFQQEFDNSVNEIEQSIEQILPQFKEHFGFDMNPQEVLRIAIGQAEENDTEIDLMGAAQYWGDMINQYRTPEPQVGFKSMPTSGGVPSTNVDVTKLSSEESKALVVDLLAQANQGGN